MIHADRNVDRIDITIIAGEVDAGRFVVEVGDPQAFAGGLGKAGSEERAARLDAGECNRRFGTLKHGVS
jgi:hypothetical protein